MKKILYLLLAAMALAGCTKTYTVPTVVTDPSPEVDAQHNNAVIHGTVTDDGGLEILEGGFYWGTDWECDNRLVFAYPGNNLSHTLTGLTNGKTYYYRAYAKNKLGEASSETQHFVFHGLTVPSVTTGTYSVSGTTATCSGSATTQSGAPLTQAGICYRAGSGTPTLSNNVRYASGVNGNTSLSFSCQITGLSAGTYSYRAFATNSAGTSYGATKTFTISGGGGGTGTYRITYNGSTWTPAVVNFFNYTSDGYMAISAYKNSGDAGSTHPTNDIRVWGYLESSTGTYTYSSSGGDIMRIYDPNDIYVVNSTIILSNNDTVDAGSYYRYFPITNTFTETITAVDLNALTISGSWSVQLADIEQYIYNNGASYGATRTLSGTLSNYHWTWSSQKSAASRKTLVADNSIKTHIPKPHKSR